MAEKESQAQLSKLMLNIRLALMSTNKHQRSVLADASDEQLLAMAANSIDGTKQASDVYFKCGSMQYTRAECEQLILDTFDVTPEELAAYEEGEFMEDVIHAIFLEKVEDSDEDPFLGEDQNSILIELSTWTRQQMEDHIAKFATLEKGEQELINRMDDKQLASHIADMYDEDSDDFDDEDDEDDDFDDFDRDEAIKALHKGGHKKSELKKMTDKKLQEMLEELDE